MQLEPCPACSRHVRTDEVACPFCAAPIGAAMETVRQRVLPKRRLGRAALMSFGLTVSAVAAAGTLEGCDDGDDDEDDTDQNAVPVYGAPTPTDAGRQNDAGNIDDRAMAIYGAPVQPPSRDASVDARKTDAGKTDAGSSDAGLPQPVSDAGDTGLDAGDVDAGEPRFFPVYGAPTQR